jgi:general secretion pathway protein E/type IV pilus assembly protein PilB
MNLPLDVIKRYKVLPLKEDERYVYLLCVKENEGISFFRKFFNKEVKVICASKERVLREIIKLEAKLFLKDIIKKIKEELRGDTKEVASVGRLLDLIIYYAIYHRASDIHFERGIVRIRVDGVLRKVFEFDEEVYLALISKIKILAKLDIASKLIQEGRFSKRVDEREFDFRVSCVNSLFGECVVLRVLESGRIIELEKLGMSEGNLAKLKRLIKSPYGMILITGPTGSGKTTTLYSILNHLKSIEKKIITIEDPVEYHIDLVEQIQVKEFADVIKAILRQDPDIIMIGEIRDEDVLNASLQAAMTGHLVLSTLHTNDAVSAINRLYQMGAKEYLVSDTLLGVVAQRLVRKICPYCKESYEASEEERKILQKFKKETKTLFKGKGCEQCDFSGYLGREMISEVFVINKEIAHLISLKKDKFELLRVGRSFGFVSMIEDGIEKVIKGVTTLDEILRVVNIED